MNKITVTIEYQFPNPAAELTPKDIGHAIHKTFPNLTNITVTKEEKTQTENSK